MTAHCLYQPQKLKKQNNLSRQTHTPHLLTTLLFIFKIPPIINFPNSVSLMICLPNSCSGKDLFNNLFDKNQDC